jgi:hypothetical protein
VTPDSLVLDIGCGWGANLEYLALERKVKNAHGITLSSAQFEEINARKLPGVQVWCVDYRDFKPTAEVRRADQHRDDRPPRLAGPAEARASRFRSTASTSTRLAVG